MPASAYCVGAQCGYTSHLRAAPESYTQPAQGNGRWENLSSLPGPLSLWMASCYKVLCYKVQWTQRAPQWTWEVDIGLMCGLFKASVALLMSVSQWRGQLLVERTNEGCLLDKARWPERGGSLMILSPDQTKFNFKPWAGSGCHCSNFPGDA